MPELPDLLHVESQLAPVFVGARIIGLRVGDPVPFRVMIDAKIPDLLLGRTLTAVERRGHFMRFAFTEDVVLVVNAMLAGRYAMVPAAADPKADPKSLVLALSFDNGKELRYLDAKRMGKIYVARPAQENTIPSYATLGVDVMSHAFTLPVFAELIRGRRDQVRNFLMDKGALASIGNAYADEILFAAGIHPKTFCYQLQPHAVEVLFNAVRSVLTGASEHIAREGPAVDEKLRDFLMVRGRAGQPCPRCKTTLRKVRVGAADSDFCPHCQPPGRALFIDWSRKP
ncbi:MAG: DNA-formamidopyrimidine glycosylase family protein [Deltaproteobacteria bacterium]|nr:DNA-formamidopyrimidine glycosylase family protein [Deltaproteobacteria bacterium]